MLCAFRQSKCVVCTPSPAAAAAIQLRGHRWFASAAAGHAGSGTGQAGQHVKPFLVTTPIYYVNGAPHIGHLYSSLLADVMARFARLEGRRVIFATGTDEHGLKIQQAAAACTSELQQYRKEQGLSSCNFPLSKLINCGTQDCEDFTSMISAKFRKLHLDFNISNTDFIRTTEPRHQLVVDWFWRRLWDRGAIYKGSYEGWYCQSDEAFLTETQTTKRNEYLARKGILDPQCGPNPRVSAESGHPVQWVCEENYMFRLSKYKTALLDYYAVDGGAHVLPESRSNEVVSFVSAGELNDLSVSRKSSKVPWAIRVPSDDSHSIYVWLDALVNYLTVAADQAMLASFKDTGIPPDVDVGALFPAWPADAHIVGKDILRFHAVFWPAFLMAAGLPLPRRIVAHGHWTVGRQKMSKSLGNVVSPNDLIAPKGAFSVDAIRYFLVREGGIASDGDFSESLLHHRCVAECADAYGNLASRVLTKTFLPGGKLKVQDIHLPTGLLATELTGVTSRTGPEMVLLAEEKELMENLTHLTPQVTRAYKDFDIPKAIELIMACVGSANKCFAASEPWKLVKLTDVESSLRLSSLLYVILETLRLSALLLSPVQPEASAVLLAQMGLSQQLQERIDQVAKFGHVSPHEYNVNITSKLVLFPKAKDAK
jgi:methionyl-tRNA synthetase